MRRSLQTLMTVGLLFGLALTARADDDALKVIDKAVKAHFPKGLDTKNQASRTKTKGTLHVMGLDLEYTQEVSVQAPDKFKEVMELNVMGNKVLVTSVFNGKEAWIRSGDTDVNVTDEILAEFKEAASMLRLTQGLFLKDKAMKYSIVGEAKVKGKPAVGVLVTREGKKNITLYFDKETGLLAKVEARKKDLMSGQEVNEERFITEYSDVEGRKTAKRVEVQRDGKEFLEAEVLEVKVFEKLDDSEFTQPK